MSAIRCWLLLIFFNLFLIWNEWKWCHRFIVAIVCLKVDEFVWLRHRSVVDWAFVCVSMLLMNWYCSLFLFVVLHQIVVFEVDDFAVIDFHHESIVFYIKKTIIQTKNKTKKGDAHANSQSTHTHTNWQSTSPCCCS